MEECEQEHNSRMKNKWSEIKLGLSFIVTDPVYKYQMNWEVSFNYGTLMDMGKTECPRYLAVGA